MHMDNDRPHFDVMESIGKHIDMLELDNGRPDFDVMQSIGKHIDMLKPCFPKQAIVCIGEHPIKILLKASFAAILRGTHSEMLAKLFIAFPILACPDPIIYEGVSVYLFASSSGTITTPAAPSVIPLQSYKFSGGAIIGD